jgi:hypothetical protein
VTRVSVHGSDVLTSSRTPALDLKVSSDVSEQRARDQAPGDAVEHQPM